MDFRKCARLGTDFARMWPMRDQRILSEVTEIKAAQTGPSFTFLLRSASEVSKIIESLAESTHAKVTIAACSGDSYPFQMTAFSSHRVFGLTIRPRAVSRRPMPTAVASVFRSNRTLCSGPGSFSILDCRAARKSALNQSWHPPIWL